MADTLPWVDEDAARAAIAAIRKDSDPTDWLIISYAAATGAQAQTLKLHASGTGGVAALAEALTDDMIGYCLARETDTFDNSVTVKFVFIFWLGDHANRMQKARTSTHMGYIKSFIGQFHVDQNATQKSEITPEVIKAKIMDFSGSGSRVLSETGEKNLTRQAASSTSSSSAPRGRITAGAGKSDQVSFADEEDTRRQLQEFRVGNGNDWIAYTYHDVGSNEVGFLGTGAGGVTELLTHLKDDNVVYALVRKIDKIDDSNTVKVAFVFWTGESTNRMLKARLGTHKGFVNSFFAPFHVDLNATQHNEVSDDIVFDLIRTASGSKVHVLDEARAAQISAPKPSATASASAAPSAAPSSGHTLTPSGTAAIGGRTTTSASANRRSMNFGKAAPGSTTDTIDLAFEDEEACRAALADVRADSSPTNWAILTYNAPSKSKTLKLHGSGSGGFEEFLSALQDDLVCYGLVRLTEVVDQSTTVKFVWVNWVGDNINRMQRALLATHKGFVSKLFSPFHVDHECNKKDEISEAIITAKIKKAAGTANFVLN
jgi:hypothetical protein